MEIYYESDFGQKDGEMDVELVLIVNVVDVLGEMFL